MATIKLTAPVGLSPRKSDGKPVKNAPKDVDLVRGMLKANGFDKLVVNKKADATLFRIIGAFQKKIGIKKPDQVIDPGGRTYKALLPKYMAAQAVAAVPDKPAPKMLAFKYRGSEYQILPEDLEKAKKDLLKRIKPVIMGRFKLAGTYSDMHMSILERSNIRKDFLTAISHSYIVPKSKIPKMKTASAALKSNQTLLVAWRSQDLAKIEDALRVSDVALQAYERELLIYYKALGSGSLTALEVIKVSRMVSFAILAAVAAPYVAKATILNEAGAFAASNVGMRVIQSAAEELEKQSAGQKVTWSSAIRNVSIDGTIATLTQGLLSKIDGKYLASTAEKIAPDLSKRLSGIAQQRLSPFLRDYQKNMGKDGLKAISEETLKVVGDMVKSGKKPTQAGVDGALKDAIYATLSGGIIKQLGDFETNWSKSHASVVNDAIMPDVLKNDLGLINLPKRVEQNIYKHASGKMVDASLKYGYDNVLEIATGKESGKKLSDLLRKRITADKTFRKMVTAQLKKAAAKYKAVPAH